MQDKESPSSEEAGTHVNEIDGLLSLWCAKSQLIGESLKIVEGTKSQSHSPHFGNSQPLNIK
jgi:hypothetical protein